MDRKSTSDRLAERLRDIYERAERMLTNGEDTTGIDIYWIDLLKQYERSYDEEHRRERTTR